MVFSLLEIVEKRIVNKTEVLKSQIRMDTLIQIAGQIFSVKTLGNLYVKLLVDSAL